MEGRSYGGRDTVFTFIHEILYLGRILQNSVPTRWEIMLDIIHECLLRRWSIYYGPLKTA